MLFFFCELFAFTYAENDIVMLRVTPNIFMISSYGGNVAFLVTEEGILVVDAGMFPYQGEEIVENIRQVSDKEIKYLVYTHYHIDHVLVAQSFPSSACIVSHVNTKNIIIKSFPQKVNQV